MPHSDDAGEPLIGDLSDSPAPDSKKRKRPATQDDESKRAAKRERRKAKKPKDVDDSALDAELGINHAIALMDSSLMADHLAQRTRRFQPELSLVEAEDLHLPASAITDTTDFVPARTTDNLSDFLEHIAKRTKDDTKKRKDKTNHGLSKSSSEPGQPHTLVIAGAGLRAADLTRELRKFQTKDCVVAKLFAKHIKLKEAVELVRTTKMGFGVGTPQRIADLIEDGVLSLSALERVVLDASHIDSKKRGILDMKEVQIPLIRLLMKDELRARYGDKKEGKVEVLFY